MAKESVEERKDRAQYSDTAEELEILASDRAKDVREAVAKNTDTPASVLQKLAGDNSIDVRISVAFHANTPTSALEKLVGDEDVTVRTLVARHANTPVSLLEKLAGDENEDVRQAVAENTNTPVSQLEKLAGDGDETVRQAVGGNKNTPISLLEKLAEDDEAWVRARVAENANTPVSLLEKLAGDEEWSVRDSVSENTNNPVSILKELAKDEDARSDLARNENTPISVVRQRQEDFISLELEASDCNMYYVDYLIEEIKNSLDVDWCKGFIDAMQSESLSNYGEDPLISFDGSSIKISKNTEPFNLKKGEIRIFGFWEYDERSTDYEYLEWARNSKITSHSIEIYPGTFFVEKFTDSNGEELNFQLEGAGGEAYYNLGVADHERNLELECTSEPEDLLRMVSTILKK